MPLTNLGDLIQREQFRRDVLHESLRKSVFWESGLIARDGEIGRLMKADVGSKFTFDYFNDLSDDPANISDDSDNLATPANIGTGTDTAVANYKNKSWGVKSITRNLSSSGDPLSAIASRIGAYWGREQDYTTVAIITGILNGNIANDAGDMVVEQSGTQITIQMVLDAIQTAGDAQDYFTQMICHSAVITSLKKQGVTDRILDDKGNYMYEGLAGLRLTARDAVETGAPNAGDYTSYLIGGGAIGYGEGEPKPANEVWRNPAIGNGGGADELYARRNYCLHPYGFSFVGNPASVSPTLAEFADGANWVRNVERKRVPIAFLRSGI